jgi:hypothetical protein
MDIRRDAKPLGEVFKMLSKTEDGRLYLLELTKTEEYGIEMLNHVDLLPTVIEIDDEPFSCTLTLAHCLVLSGYEEIHLALSKMPARILELKTGGGDKVVELLLARGSPQVREALAGNAEALKIICGEFILDSGQMDVLGIKINVVDPADLNRFRGNSLAHLLLAGNPSDAVVKRIAVAPKEVLDLVNMEGRSVEQMLKEKIGPAMNKRRC